ncbi:hypothetical protein BDV39DRAFT_207314 [Aspergillus sergii]|uniref:Uncharacterized protein n=1 Tax=Aspergillus sergii TaxID=1034303 RepID=A0A5N6WW85_9EURO|nr:hypothetical protein BDV39DRAFT_207314 [Aspergillus sergii]
MSGLQHSRGADGPVTAAAAGAGGDPNRGGRRGRDGKKPPADRVTVNKGWYCKFGCKTIHPGKPCPMIELGQRMWAIREQYLRERDSTVAAYSAVLASLPAADHHGASAPSRRGGVGAPRGANTPTPGGSSIRPLPAAADGNNNSSAGNRNEGGERRLNHRQRRSRARLQAFQAQRQRQQQQQQHASTGDTQMGTEMATATPAGESQSESISAPGASPETGA